MPSFFHGWRSKAGVFTLALALTAFGVWMRSRLICDQFVFPHNGYQWDVFSADGCLIAFVAKLAPLEVGDAGWWSGKNHRDDPSAPQLSLMVYKIRPAVWVLHYWLIVIPLTLLSAYLILWKPPKANSSAQPAISDFISN